MTSKLKNVRDYAAFRAFIVQHFAALTEISSRYTLQMVDETREEFFELTLQRAWDTQQDWNPSGTSFVRWWTGCCEHAARSKDEWTVLTITGWKIVKGKHLGRLA